MPKPIAPEPAKFFTARLFYGAVVADEISDADADPQLEGVSAGVTITARVVNPPPPDQDEVAADEIPVSMLSPESAMLVLAPIDARLDHGGHLCLRYDPDVVSHSYTSQAAFPATGTTAHLFWAADVDKMFRWDPDTSSYVETEPYAPVRLVCDTDLLELPDGAILVYTVDFDHVRFAGADRSLPSFTFKAPSTDIVLDLNTAERVYL